MEWSYRFPITPMEVEPLYPQVGRALALRAELASRARCPRLWALTDRFRRAERGNRRLGRGLRYGWLALAVINWLLGSLLMLVGLTEPQGPAPLLTVGAVGLGIAGGYLWKHGRTLLGVLALLQAVLFTVGALGSPEKMGELLLPGILSFLLGFAALLLRKRRRVPFERAARRLLRGKDTASAAEGVWVTFSEGGMHIGQDGSEEHWDFSYGEITALVETEDLLLPICLDHILVLQKKNLCNGTMAELRALLSSRVRYLSAAEEADTAR